MLMTSLFSIVQNKNNSASQLNNDLDKVSDWVYTWKMSFNPDPSKQAQEGHTLTMVILCMISQIMKHLLIKLRKHNMMQH